MTFFRLASRPLQLVIVGATLAVAWSTVSVTIGAAAPSEAEANADGLAPLSSLGSVTDPLAPAVAPVTTLAAPVTAAVAPGVVPASPVAAPPVAAPPVAAVAVAVAAAPVAAPAIQPVAAVVAPVTASVITVTAPVLAPVAPVAPVVTAVATPLSTIVAPVAHLTTDVVTLVRIPAIVGSLDSLRTAMPSNVVAVANAIVTPTSMPTPSDTFPRGSVDRAAFTGPLSGAVQTVPSQESQELPASRPLGAPLGNSNDQPGMPAPAGSSSGQGGSAGGPNAASDSPPTTPLPARRVLSGSTFGTDAVPSAPTFDPGSSPD
ncbi:hypothetical protein [Cryobacterium sp. MLB-32]|uniref:hypothetical protein n=1 Tax=Cryobacterium sp. MLB-32 TaxID=1529318 RepID=UPI001E3B49F6|nr:hypothetical protein [Cryobacterium sp. MLB-32]